MNLTPNEWLDRYEALYRQQSGDGKWLEQLVCDIGGQVASWDLHKVVHWNEWGDREKYYPGKSAKDIGIDNVGVRKDGSLVAIQCKARKPQAELTKADVDSFGSEARRLKIWKERWVVTNAEFNSKLKEQNRSEADYPLKQIDFVEPLRVLAGVGSAGRPDDPALNAVQDDCIEAILKRLPEHEGRNGWREGESRCQIVLPCGTGKTRVAYRAMKELVSTGEIAIVLVPSIALVSQIKGQFQHLAHRDALEMQTIAVCSDKTAGQTRTSEGKSLADHPTLDVSHTATYEVIGDTASTPKDLIDWLRERQGGHSILAIFSTYQSAHHTATAMRELHLTAKLTIMDEAHRTAGMRRIKAGEDHVRNFVLCHDSERFPSKYRIYQTATPKIYNVTRGGSKSSLGFEELDDTEWDVKSMNHIPTFGPEVYRLSYKDAVEGHLLSDYHIIAFAISEEEIDEVSWEADVKPEVSALALTALLSGVVKEAKVKSVIAFHNTIAKSKKMAAAIGTEPVKRWVRGQKHKAGHAARTEYTVEHIDASSSSSKRREALHRLADATIENPHCISNVGIFGEGTDSPDLSAVAFLEPRKSAVDVIQAVGRAMRKSPNKDKGYIFVPVRIPAGEDAENFLARTDESSWKELGQILKALRCHDGRIEDNLQDLMSYYCPPEPKERPYQNYLYVVHEPYKSAEVYDLHTRNYDPILIVQPWDEEDASTLKERLERNEGSLTHIVNPATDLYENRPPHKLVVVQRQVSNRENQAIVDRAEEFKTIERPPSARGGGADSWLPVETIDRAKKHINRDKTRTPEKRTMRELRPRKTKDEQAYELGRRFVHQGDLGENRITLNLLQKSGILGGARRDVNLLRSTVARMARDLRGEGLEELLAERLEMTHIQRVGKDKADACTVAALIWLQAAIMHARLEKHDFRQLRRERSIEEAISDPEPATALMQSWQAILQKDYVPIFGIALRLLTDATQQRGRQKLSTALNQMAKDAVHIAGTYAQLGMDHAGELFNSMMGDQRSDGAFFTMPLSATMLTELSLEAYGPVDWLDENEWEKLRTFDPACGSGTILVAMLTSMKERLLRAGADSETIRRFHKFAVEELIVGADIHPVSLQLAGSQLTLGDESVGSYDQMNLHEMPYGVESDAENAPAIAGTAELLLDDKFTVRKRGDLGLATVKSRQLDPKLGYKDSEISEILGEKGGLPAFVLMNPPYTKWKDVGEKFSTSVQAKLRKRLTAIWDDAKTRDSMLDQKKTSVAILFEALALNLIELSEGVMGCVCAGTFLTAANSSSRRRLFATRAHIDYVLTSFDPRMSNMSWDTSINECLIVMSKRPQNAKKPTRFINLHRYPADMQEARSIIHKAMIGEIFAGSTIEWDYEHMKQGDWWPAAFTENILAEKLHQAISGAERLRTDLIGSSSRQSSSVPPPPPRKRWRVGRFDI